LVALSATSGAFAAMCRFNVGTIGTSGIVVIDLAIDLANGVPPFA
jgi:hypothetical protein